jgi:cytochrome P450
MSPTELRTSMSAGPPEMLGTLDQEAISADPLMFMHQSVIEPIEERQRQPRDDGLTELAHATYPDGSTPEFIEVVRSAAFLLVAGGETTPKLLTSAMRVLSERPDIQQQLRDDRSLIPAFIEECLRYVTPVKAIFRLARKSTVVGDVEIAAGTVVMLCNDAANHDPRRFDNPEDFRLDRQNSRQHMSFGHGIHSCLGAALARTEARVAINRILDRMAEITIDEEQHGPEGDRRYVYEPNYVFRGLTALHVEFRCVSP